MSSGRAPVPPAGVPDSRTGVWGCGRWKDARPCQRKLPPPLVMRACLSCIPAPRKPHSWHLCPRGSARRARARGDTGSRARAARARQRPPEGDCPQRAVWSLRPCPGQVSGAPPISQWHGAAQRRPGRPTAPARGPGCGACSWRCPRRTAARRVRGSDGPGGALRDFYVSPYNLEGRSSLRGPRHPALLTLTALRVPRNAAHVGHTTRALAVSSNPWRVSSS